MSGEASASHAELATEVEALRKQVEALQVRSSQICAYLHWLPDMPERTLQATIKRKETQISSVFTYSKCGLPPPAIHDCELCCALAWRALHAGATVAATSARSWVQMMVARAW
jgi:hypothetical protein